MQTSYFSCLYCFIGILYVERKLPKQANDSACPKVIYFPWNNSIRFCLQFRHFIQISLIYDFKVLEMLTSGDNFLNEKLCQNFPNTKPSFL